MVLKIQVLALDRHKHVAGLNQLMEFQPAQIHFHSKKPHTIIKMNDDRLILNINMYWMLQCLSYFFLGSCINPACNLWIWSKVSRLVTVEFKS